MQKQAEEENSSTMIDVGKKRNAWVIPVARKNMLDDTTESNTFYG